MKTLHIITLAAVVAQIGGPVVAAVQITSPAVVTAALEAKKACALAAQTATMELVDLTTVVNLERVKALCDAAAGKVVPQRDWPEETGARIGLPYGAEGLFDAQNLSEGIKALFECGQLAKKRAAAGKASITPAQITEIAQPTKPHVGLAVFDPWATVAFVEARNMCANAKGDN